MNVNVICPVNSMGYGVTGLQTLRFLDEVGHDVTWFPIGATSLPENHDLRDLLHRIHFGNKDYDPGAPSYRMFHEFDSVMFPIGSGKKLCQVVFELDSVSDRSVHLLKQLDAVAVPSNWAADVLKKHIPEKPVHIIPHGIDMGIFEPTEIRSLPVEISPFTFISVGKWEARKSQEEIVKAFVQEFSEKEPVCLRMMCDNKFIPDAEMEAIKSAYQKPGRLIFVPWSETRYGVAAQIEDSDCGVYAPKAEGWGLSIMETMACNRPVVTTRNTGITGYIPEGSQSIIEIESGELIEARDGRFFTEGHGRWHSVQIEDIRKGMREAFQRGRVANPEGVKIATEFSWHNTVSAIERALEETPPQQ